MKLKAKAAIATALLCATLAPMAGCASAERFGTTVESELNGGLNRVAILYDYNGDEIRRWEGVIDVRPTSEANQAGRVLFDIDGQRTIIEGGILVVQEVG